MNVTVSMQSHKKWPSSHASAIGLGFGAMATKPQWHDLGWRNSRERVKRSRACTLAMMEQGEPANVLSSVEDRDDGKLSQFQAS